MPALGKIRNADLGKSLVVLGGNTKLNKGLYMRDSNLSLKFKKNKLLLGVFYVRDGNCLDVYIYLFPCIEIHFSCWGKKWGMNSLDADDNKLRWKS